MKNPYDFHMSYMAITPWFTHCTHFTEMKWNQYGICKLSADDTENIENYGNACETVFNMKEAPTQTRPLRCMC